MRFAPHCTAGLNSGFGLDEKTDNPDNSNAYLKFRLKYLLIF